MDPAIRHQAAIFLSNAAVRSLTSKNSYKSALVTLRDSIRIIKSCIVDVNEIPEHPTLTPEEVNRMIRQGFQRLEEFSSIDDSLVPYEALSSQNGDTSSIVSMMMDAIDQQLQPSIYVEAISSKHCCRLVQGIVRTETESGGNTLSSLRLLLDTMLSAPIVANIRKPNVYLYPMIIDDEPICNFSVNDVYHHHSIILLYNYGIAHQCLAFVEQDVQPQGSSDKISTGGGRPFQMYMTAADRIFRMIYQSLNDQVQPQQLLEIMNGESKTNNIDTSMSRKYLPMMILINYNMILVSHARQLPAELTIHYSMVETLLFLLTAFDWNYFKDCFDTAVAA